MPHGMNDGSSVGSALRIGGFGRLRRYPLPAPSFGLGVGRGPA